MEKVELLMPAGNLEKLEYAVKYGADAVYLGVVDFSLRAMRKGSLITLENLKDAVDLAHKLGAKAYVTLNIFAFNRDIKLLEECIDRFKDAQPDAFIVSDFGIMNLLRKYAPEVPIHVSTQTNTLNYESVKFWQDYGASRVILARELPIKDVAEIRAKVPDIELECFVHGSQCVSFSGRCLLSDYFTNGERKANHGNCSQPCRWSYKLVESTRPDQYYEINQDERGSHILSPKDLCLVEYLSQMIDAGVNSFKVEGRTKSLYYVSAVAKTYRAAINEVLKNPSADLHKYFIELQKVGNRGYTTGFALGDNNSESYSYDISKGLAGADFLCEFKSSKEPLKTEEGVFYAVKIKNKMLIGDEVEIITPHEQFKTKLMSVKDKNGIDLPLANTNDDVYLLFDQQPEDYKYALARTIGVKNNVS
ncbi:TPA: U32 family peptidase C-terminal domain-containing protein [Candidatus Scatenecus faecavium]|uniref:U32 family peptidase C-terminal domain-containing protein n=1 Tax=Candidatus Scatenecus faecavium TaxID=2840915 RepID=A0A9D1FWK5_9BACT|nr:U32 family peptidase C-terminal domain-containing protein [Candidatus Scatenecus faecavium]